MPTAVISELRRHLGQARIAPEHTIAHHGPPSSGWRLHGLMIVPERGTLLAKTCWPSICNICSTCHVMPKYCIGLGATTVTTGS